jgi:murein DD-endopeptidase MepM/ murein hydrolase activator NlpD
VLVVPGVAASAAAPFGIEGTVPRTVSQGDVFSVTVAPSRDIEDLTGTLEDEPLLFFPVAGGRLRALVGVDLEAEGRRRLRLEATDRGGERHTREWSIRIRPRRVRVQRLTLPSRMVELDAETAARVSEEADRLGSLWGIATPTRQWTRAFLPPVATSATPEGFGVRRIINDQPRSPHSGADYRAQRGSIVRASNAGRVVLAEEQFFAGNALVIDHGLGLYTMYFHLEASLVKTGDSVGRGQAIGRVGATGRATGPHLHFGVRLRGARVDPVSLLRLSPS